MTPQNPMDQWYNRLTPQNPMTQWYDRLNVRPLNLHDVKPQKSAPPGHSHGLLSTLKLYNRLSGGKVERNSGNVFIPKKTQKQNKTWAA